MARRGFVTLMTCVHSRLDVLKVVSVGFHVVSSGCVGFVVSG